MDVQEKIALIAEVLGADNISATTKLADLENWDSMGKLSLIVLCDDEFGKKLTSDEMKGFATVQDILDFIN